jgi:hypothetical protein
VNVAKRKVNERTQNVSLKSVVGEATYRVWVDMLKHLVPDGRTHRLAPMVAGMLQYASERGYQRSRAAPREGSVASVLLSAAEHEDEIGHAGRLTAIVEQLFLDAGVKSSRVSRRGERYSLVDAAIEEFVRWDSMPWE